MDRSTATPEGRTMGIKEDGNPVKSSRPSFHKEEKGVILFYNIYTQMK
jgi:hypothetical protein